MGVWIDFQNVSLTGNSKCKTYRQKKIFSYFTGIQALPNKHVIIKYIEIFIYHLFKIVCKLHFLSVWVPSTLPQILNCTTVCFFHVFVETAALSKPSVTSSAFKFLFSCVYRHVLSQSRYVWIFFSTETAEQSASGWRGGTQLPTYL